MQVFARDQTIALQKNEICNLNKKIASLEEKSADGLERVTAEV